jgi:hypothetical protein
MAATRPPHFPHRKNQDGSWSSICSECVLTIATEVLEKDLETHEKNHLCEGLDLLRLSIGQQPSN